MEDLEKRNFKYKQEVEMTEEEKELQRLEDKFDKIKHEQENQEEVQKKKYQGKQKTPAELEKEKAEVIQQIKDLEEGYYHPEQKMDDKEFDQIEANLKQHPLFMKEVPENIEENPHYSAMQSVIYDDTPENIAKYNNDKGNEFFKKGQDKGFYLGEALKCYTEGIDAKSSDAELNSKLHNNRALIHLKKKNYGKCIEDCKESIKQNPQFVKAYFRCAQAYGYLQKYKESVATLETAQRLDQNNKEIKKLLGEHQQKLNKFLLEQQKKKDVKQTEENVLFNTLKIRNIYLGKPIMEFPDGVNKSCWMDEEGKLHFPTFIQYPEFQQMDYIQDIPEDHIFANQIDALIGPNGIPYDTNQIYNINNVELYIELNIVQPYYDLKNPKNWSRQKGLLKIDMNKKISTILATKGYVLPRVAEFYMVCPESKDFYEHFKRNFQFISLDAYKNNK